MFDRVHKFEPIKNCHVMTDTNFVAQTKSESKKSKSKGMQIIPENISESLSEQLDVEAEKIAKQEGGFVDQYTHSSVSKMTKAELKESLLFCNEQKKTAFWMYYRIENTLFNKLNQWKSDPTSIPTEFMCAKCGKSYETLVVQKVKMSPSCDHIYCYTCYNGLAKSNSRCLICSEHLFRPNYKRNIDEIMSTSEHEKESKKKKKMNKKNKQLDDTTIENDNKQ